MLSSLYALGAVVTPAGTINQIGSHSLDSGLQNLIAASDGQVDPTFAAVQSQRPMLTFTTSAIARALGFAGISGLAVTAGIDFWFQQLAQGGTRSGGATSTKFSALKGILCPRSLTADNEGVATIDYAFAAISADGTSSPLAIAISSAMPAPPTTREYFTCGPVNINGTLITGVTSIRVDFGMEIIAEGSDGEAYPTFSAIMRRTPTITVRTKDVNAANSLGFSVAQNALTDTLVYLRKILAGGTRVPNATAEHVKLTIDDGMITVRSAGGQDGQTQEAEIEIAPIFDGTNDIMAVSAASAIA